MLSLLILLINRIQCPGILGLCSLQCAQQDAGECNEAQCRLGLHLHTQPILLHGDVHQRFLVWSITCVQGNHQRGRRHVRLLGGLRLGCHVSCLMLGFRSSYSYVSIRTSHARTHACCRIHFTNPCCSTLVFLSMGRCYLRTTP